MATDLWMSTVNHSGFQSSTLKLHKNSYMVGKIWSQQIWLLHPKISPQLKNLPNIPTPQNLPTYFKEMQIIPSTSEAYFSITREIQGYCLSSIQVFSRKDKSTKRSWALIVGKRFAESQIWNYLATADWRHTQLQGFFQLYKRSI